MFPRFLREFLIEALEYMPIVLIRGARQSGKSTLVKSIQNTPYVSLDHLPTFIAAQEDPVGFISGLKKPVIIDEIQRVPELFLPIKEDVDQHRTEGRYILTGSADPLLIPQMADSLAGRMRLLTLWPLSQGEILNRKESFLEKIFTQGITPEGPMECSKESLIDLMFRGGFPNAVALKKTEQIQNWLNDYTSLILQKDILDLSKIENIMQIPRFLMLLATRVGATLNMEELGRTLQLPSVTLHRYLHLLCTLFLVHLLPAWSFNLGKRVVKSPKLYFIDTALALYALGFDRARLQQDPYLLGNLLENFVACELFKQASWNKHKIQFYHYRDYKQNEVDLVLEGPQGTCVVIEIKSSETVSKNDFKCIKILAEDLKEKFIQGIVLYAGNKIVPFGNKLVACPISFIWS